MLPNKEFYLVMNDAGSSMALGAPGQDADGRFPNYELAAAAAQNSWSTQDGQTMYIVHAVRTVVATVSGTTNITVTPV